MKNLTKLFALAIVVLGFSASSIAQNTASATASASGTIITPIAITRMADMQFGNITASAAGTVTLNPLAAPTYIGVIAYATPGTVSTANFDVTGNFSNAYSVTLSNLPTEVKHTDNTTTMAIDLFTSNVTGAALTGTGTLDALGKQTINVGATLHVVALQKAGVYTSASPFTVTVNYN